jgi:two-component system alkaline phosphatase synthesis response regulator PhoP
MAKEKILVVDDEEDILELVRYNLAREGYQVTGTLTGEDALRKVRSDSFDLIVLDLMLPGMDGLAFTKTLKNDSRLRSIPIIMLTAKGEEAGRLPATRITVILPGGPLKCHHRGFAHAVKNRTGR